uniref:Eukaryotic translation initiation factor 3 subunit A n=1 Tax=Strigamia maritima TaxID=126957 RepID=T1IIY3_STRMM
MYPQLPSKDDATVRWDIDHAYLPVYHLPLLTHAAIARPYNMPTYFQRPENALKRANEFIDVGKKQRALDALYDVIKSKKHRTWQKIHEPIMNKYLELCVELKKSHVAKEGLFQYRNICQQVNIKSLEDVVRGYLQLAEDKTELARDESQQAVIDIDDLDNLLTPESLLLSAVSGEDAQDRTDRVVLTPWVKFLWESYRQCLELLRNNSRVERLYHDIAQQAFKFCLKYNRKTEFRKLCDNLRTHLSHIHKHQNQQTAINLNNPESQGMHLETRLCQLDSGIQMELWQEAYKAIEDIHGLMNLSKKPPKPQLMANYYHKLALVFWKAGNYLFHASALFRLFHLSREMKKNLTNEEVQRMASRVLLATLAVPIPPARNDIDKYLEVDETTMDKQRRLATLLGLSNPPNRSNLIKDLVRFTVIQHVGLQLQDLYRWLEVEFHPLKLSVRIQQCFDFIEKNDDWAELKQYIVPLQDVTLTRLLKQVSQVYQTIRFSRLLELAPFADAFHLERVVVDAAKNNDLQVRIDHRTKCLEFGMDLCVAQREDLPEGPNLQAMPSEQIRNQLVTMSSVLFRSIALIEPTKRKLERETIRQAKVAEYHRTASTKHLRVLARRQIIEERKELLENLNIQREEEERRVLEEQRKKQLLLEEERLQREADERERQRRMEEHKEIKRKHVKDKIEQLKKTGCVKFFQEMDEEELENLDADEIMAKQVEQLDRERKELQAKLKSQEKKVDYLERAKRLEEIPLLQNALELKRIKARQLWDQQEQERIKQLIEDRKTALQHCERLSRLKTDKEEFIEKLRAARASIHKAKLQEFETRLEAEKQKRSKQRKEERKRERRIRYEQEKAEEEERKIEEEKRQRIEEEEKAREAKKAAEAAAYEARKQELDRQAAKQKAREKEIEERRRQQEEEQLNKGREARRGDGIRARDEVRGGGGGGLSSKADEGDWRRKEDKGEKVPAWKPRESTTTYWQQKDKESVDKWKPTNDERRIDESRNDDRRMDDRRNDERRIDDRRNDDRRIDDRRNDDRRIDDRRTDDRRIDDRRADDRRIDDRRADDRRIDDRRSDDRRIDEGRSNRDSRDGDNWRSHDQVVQDEEPASRDDDDRFRRDTRDIREERRRFVPTRRGRDDLGPSRVDRSRADEQMTWRRQDDQRGDDRRVTPKDDNRFDDGPRFDRDREFRDKSPERGADRNREKYQPPRGQWNDDKRRRDPGPRDNKDRDSGAKDWGALRRGADERKSREETEAKRPPVEKIIRKAEPIKKREGPDEEGWTTVHR